MRSRWVTAALAASLLGCEAAPLPVQSTATFALAFRCEPAEITARQEPPQAGAWYERFDVRGCGRRQIYVCANDIGCVPPAEVPENLEGGPGRRFPPTLVDQAPPAPQ